MNFLFFFLTLKSTEGCIFGHGNSQLAGETGPFKMESLSEPINSDQLILKFWSTSDGVLAEGYPVNSPTDQLADANSPMYKIE